MPSGAARRRGPKHALFILLALCALLGPALAQSFPPLAGRVVDAANLLGAEQRRALEAKLKAHEDRTTDQVVVATVPSLGGTSIEDFANRLFRHWQLGQKARNNGVLLLVAPNERKVRIEVGYGLEGALTDALSGVIIRTAMAPRFRAGDFAGGIDAGVDAVLSILTGDAEEWQRRAKVRADDHGELDWFTVAFMLVILIIVIRAFFRNGGGPSRYHRSRGGSWVILPTPGGGWGGGFSGGGGFGGGFFGGGGSSGGGGASGSW
ncbi:TPM domain-containing protein [Enterovirga aerilata]|uniref:TPM domain-containing protein n=1 Tax=Enterovirga aerilata TaxID=2730920 RepID=UPI001AED1A3C